MIDLFKTKFLHESKNYMMKILSNIIYILSEKSIILVDKESGNCIKKKEVFKKNRRSRQFFIDGDYLYCREFCTLYKVDVHTLEILYQWELGTDLSSDICGIDYDKHFIYAAIRNGPLAKINKQTKTVTYHPLTTSSIWDIKVIDKIYGGNVNGELLIIDKESLDVKLIKAHKKNLKSLIITKDTIYTGSQDLSLGVFDKNTMLETGRIKKCHQKMFYVLGIWSDFIITVSAPCQEMKIWHKKDLALHKKIPYGNWNMAIDKDILYRMTSEGIFYIDMNDLI